MFFESGLHQVSLDPPAQLKKDSQNRKRIKVFVTMVLTAENLTGAPGEVQAAVEGVGALSKGITKSVISTTYEHVDVEFHPLVDRPTAIAIKDATIQSIYVNRKTPKEGAPQEVFLHMSTTAPYSKKLWDYVGENGGATVWVDFLQAQGVFQEEDAPAATQGRLDGGSDKVKPFKRPKKSGKGAAAGDAVN